MNINYKYATSIFYFLLIFNFRNYFEYFKNSLILFLLLIIFRHCLLLRIQEGVPVILISIPSRIQVQVHLQYKASMQCNSFIHYRELGKNPATPVFDAIAHDGYKEINFRSFQLHLRTTFISSPCPSTCPSTCPSPGPRLQFLRSVFPSLP